MAGFQLHRAAALLLNEAEALLRVEELYGTFTRADDLGRHARGTATATAAAEATATATAAEAATVAAAEAATTAIASATAAVTAAATEAAAITSAEATAALRAAKRIEAVFAETVALVPSPFAAAAFVVTHDRASTLIVALSPRRARRRAAITPGTRVHGDNRRSQAGPMHSAKIGTCE